MKKVIIVLLVFIVSVSLVTFFYGGCRKYKVDLKEFKETEKQNISKQKSFELKIDSVKPIIKIIKKDIEKSKYKISPIKQRYNEERNRIIILPIDSQVRIMSKWISEIDTIR